MAEPPALHLGERAVGADQIGEVVEEIVEVAHAPGALGVLVPGVELPDSVDPGRRPAPGRARRAGVGVGWHEAGPGPVDLGRDLGRRWAGAAGGVDERRYETGAVGEQLGRTTADIGRPLAQHAERNSVERADGRSLAQTQVAQA